MSLKDLFGKNTEKIVSNKDLKELQDQVESEGFLQENIKDKERFLPAIDFSSSSNFAKYGLAEKYYNDAFENIYNFYPYDGSLKEKQQWLNTLTQFDLYVYNNIYPKTTGFINLGSGSVSSLTTASVSYRYSSSPQYVVIKGGPNASPTGKFNDSNIYNVDTNRESNLALTENGNTVEFWFKDNVEVSNTYTNNTYCLFDLWNANVSGSHNYTRLTIENSSSNFYVTYASGSTGVQQKALNYSIDKANWHHYAFVFANNSNNITITLYVDGEQADSVSTTLPNSIALANNKGNIANIGSFRTNKQATEATSWNGIGNCFGSIDEFRFWKSTRTARQIYRFYFTHVNGGSNTDDSNTNLGVYYKFNEGIVSPSEINATDAICLDYSGRISNGTIKNYALNVRSTGSAIDTFFEEAKEQKDVIVIATNSLVSSTLNNYLQEAKDYDQENSSNIYRSLPAWITEEDENIDNKELKNLIQTVSSYFDTLHLQIEALSKLGNIEYYDQNSKPKPFIDKILSSYNFDNLEIFNDTTFIEDILSRNETKEFDKKINDIKNVIYQNIYNNLAYIYKSKGTEKSLRNLIRCFGVDDELIKINLYASNSTYEFNEKYKYVSALKKFVDFNDPNRYVGTVIQKKIIDNDDSRGYIAGNTSSIQDYSPSVVDYLPLTLQAEIIFPKKVEFGNEKYDIPTFSEVSLFGVHTANNKDNDLTWGTDPFNFHVLAVKRNFDSSDVYFKFTGSLAGYGFNVTSSWYKETYNNEKWNLAVRLKPEKYTLSNAVSGSATGNFLIDLIGYNTSLDVIQNSFSLSQTIPEANAKSALLNDKRIFAGAHYSNFNTSSILHKTDVKISSIRYWLDYLTDEEIKVHSFDVANYGRLNPDWKPDYSYSIFNSSSIFTKSDTLLLNWDFSNVSSSDENGEFIVYDLTSGSKQIATNKEYGVLGQICKYHHGGFGTSFYENDTQVINKEYIHSAKQLQPEVMAYSDTITTPDTDDVTRTKDSRPVSYYISIEKSMAQVINDQMINWFATIKYFNNLIGDPSERYRKEYKGLQHLRKIYFQNVKNTPDFEKFITFYKWIDSSISTMISQLIPASANVSNKVRNIVESHLLERSKYENKLPTLELKGEPVTSLSSFLEYKYEDQAAPGVITNSGSVLWIKERAERSAEVFANPSVSAESQEIRDAANFNTLNKLPTLYSSDTSQNYIGKRDEIRKFNKPYKLETSKPLILEATIKPLRIGNEQFTGRYVFADELDSGSSNDIFNTPKNGYSVDIKVDLPEEYNKFEPPAYRPKPGGFLPGNYINELENNNSYFPPAGRSYVLGPFLEREGYFSFGNPYQYGGNDYGFLSQFTAADGLVNYAFENIFDNGPDNFGKIFASTPDGGIIVAGPNKSPTRTTTNRDKLYVFTTASNGTYFLSKSINFNFGVNGGSIGPTTILDSGDIYTVAFYYNDISLSYKFGLFTNGVLTLSDNFLTAATLDAQSYPQCSIAAGEGDTYYIGLRGADGGAGRVIQLPANIVFTPPNIYVQGYGTTVKYINGSGLYVAASNAGNGMNGVFGPNNEIYYPSSSFSSMVGVDFGASIAGSGDTLVFGAPTDQSDNDAYVNGLVYVYKGGELQTTLSASGVTSLFNGDHFGSSVSVSKNGKIIAVGAPKAKRDSQSSTIVRQEVGYVSMWYYDGSQWLPDASITNFNFPSDYDRFGTNVLITNNLKVIVTTPRDDVSNGILDQGWKNVGSVQIFASSNPQTIYELIYTDPVYTYSKYSDGIINWGAWGRGGGVDFGRGEGEYKIFFAIYGSEYSIYKSLNYINLRVRDTLDKWLAESSSIDTQNPSYHKTPKNPAYLATKTQYDNAFVTHQIPRSDIQYAWITASVITKPQFSGYITQYSNLNVFNSSSFQLLSGTISGSEIIDYTGLNTHLIKNVNTSSNTISSLNNLSGTEVNKYFSNLNGPYQHPSWKQIRNANNKLVIETRKNNIYTVRDLPVIKFRVDENNKLVSYVDKNDGSFTSFKEPPVTYNFPMEHLLNVTGSRDSINVVSTYDNNKKKLSNTNLANRLGIKAKDDAQAHDILVDLEDGLYYPKPEIINVKYTTNIFPSDLNVGIKEIRNKPNYEETNPTGLALEGRSRNIATIRSFWNNTIEDRARKPNAIKSSNFYEKLITGFTFISSSFRIGWPSATTPAGSHLLKLNLTKSNSDSFDTIWSLDNNLYYTYNSSSVLSPLAGNIITSSLYLSKSYLSELAGHDDWFELRNMLKKPIGGFYGYRRIDESSASINNYEFFDIASAAANELVPLPKPSLIYKLHIPSTLYYGITLSVQYYISTYTFINKGYVFTTPEISGKYPWFNNYEEYFADIKPHSKNYSLLPEYKISDHMDYFIKQKNGDFNSIITSSYLTLDGVNYDYNSITSSYNTTNNLNTFIFDDINSSNKSIKITINGIMKLLPYKGFYPNERAVQLVDLFQKSFFGFENPFNYVPIGSDFFDANDLTKYATSDQGWLGERFLQSTPIFQQMQTVFQTMFAPGILFNTIKSGIAVDWPVIVLNNNELNYNSSFNETLYSSGSTLGGAINGALFTIGREPSTRMDFESIIDFKKSFDNITYKSLFYLDPSRLSIDMFSGSDRDLIKNPNYNLFNEARPNKDSSYLDNRYKLAINNYLAEIPNFFLVNSSLTTFISKPAKTFKTLYPGKRYEMLIKLSKDKNLKMVVGNSNVYPSIRNDFYTINFEDTGGFQNILIPEASCFGPPYKVSNTIFFSYTNHAFYNDPAYAPYVPPYYYGERTLKVYLDVPSSEVARRWELEEIFSNLEFEESFPELEDIFLSSSVAMSGGTATQVSLASGDVTLQELQNAYRNSPAYKGIMPISASLNILGKTNTKLVTYDEKGNIQSISDAENATDGDSWVIQPKFESPVLDFNNINNINSINAQKVSVVKTSNMPSDHTWTNNNVTTGFTGMWSGYGNIPTDNKGIKLSISNTIPGNSRLTRSLADIVGFETVEKKIGQLASTKEISEAIILIPYTNNFNDNEKTEYATNIPAIFGENGFTENRIDLFNPSIFGKGLKKKINYLKSKQNYPFYFKVNLSTINKILDINFDDLRLDKSQIIKNTNNSLKDEKYANNTILKTIKLMSEYNLPPHLDWVTNRKINPFVMYIVEFKHILEQQDLSDIWQGVMPKIAKQAQIKDVELTQDFGPDEFFHGKKLPPDIKWKIFKVKKKANINYYSLTADDADDEKFKFKFNNSNTAVVPDYSYNWPYDFFSLVELANVNIELESDRQKNIESDRKILLDERAKTVFALPKGLSNKKEIFKTIAGLEEIARRAFNSLPNRNVINPARGNLTNVARTIFRENRNAVINSAINIGVNNAPQTNNNPGSSFGIGIIR